jgi:hypothetical protein
MIPSLSRDRAETTPVDPLGRRRYRWWTTKINTSLLARAGRQERSRGLAQQPRTEAPIQARPKPVRSSVPMIMNMEYLLSA